jgi:hypothetical protein
MIFKALFLVLLLANLGIAPSELLFAKHRLAAPYPNIKGMKTSYEYVAVTRPEVWKHKPKEFVDASFVEELDKSGFIKKLYDK